jgi:flavodoxin
MMKIIVIYDSKYGHTEKIAKSIGESVDGQVIPVEAMNPADLTGCDLVILGSPTHGGWFTEGIKKLLETSPTLEGASAAVFDTRTRKSLFGFASIRMARSLEKNGVKLIAPPEGFIVQGTKGPLIDGELERAAAWAQEIVRSGALPNDHE